MPSRSLQSSSHPTISRKQSPSTVKASAFPVWTSECFIYPSDSFRWVFAVFFFFFTFCFKIEKNIFTLFKSLLLLNCWYILQYLLQARLKIPFPKAFYIICQIYTVTKVEKKAVECMIESTSCKIKLKIDSALQLLVYFD